jgi:hypothetical protein
MKLSDLMTAEQALKIIEMLEKQEQLITDLTKRLENIENENTSSNY